MADRFRYAAFISYSSKDASFAQRLHRALEGYRIPISVGEFDLIGDGNKNRIYPVFRDREELSAGALGERIEEALSNSRALIVVCSPNSAASAWVQKEIEFFEQLGRQQRIYSIIPTNAPIFDEAGNDATATCFPAVLGGKGSADSTGGKEPIAGDARKGKDGFRNAWLKIVAAMIGLTPGRLINRDQKRRRQAVLRMCAVWAIAAFGVGFAYAQQDTLAPFVISVLKYKPFVNSNELIAAAAPGTIFQDCHVGSMDCPIMVAVPEGRFMMGVADDDPETRSYERPQHEVSIRRFAVSRYEITFGNWEACLRARGCNGYAPERTGGAGDNRPANLVSWNDAQAYVAWLSRMTGERYRLLSEAEWEYAARAVTSINARTTRFSWGDENPVCDRAAVNGAASVLCEEHSTLPVGSFHANAFGLYDMHGNLWEWVQDCVAESYDGLPTDGSANANGDCTRHVLRGGAWYIEPSDLRSAVRNWEMSWNRSNGRGFRVARSLSSN